MEKYDYKEYIKSDCFRYYGKNDWFTILKAFFRNELFRLQFVIRMGSKYNDNLFTRNFGRFLYHFSKTRKRIQIPIDIKIGYGFCIAHGVGIVINPNCCIGCNCTIYQFLSIGSQSGKGAKIGDNVYIGPHVSIVENVKIGDNVTIGAGSVVVKDIPDNATAAGNYAKVLNYDNPKRFIFNEWKTDV